MAAIDATVFAAYEKFGDALANQDLRISTFRLAGIDREQGAVAVVLDGSGELGSAESDAATIEAWASNVAPVPVLVTIDPRPGKFSPLA